MDEKVSRAGDIALPVCDVTLKHLQDTAGQPVVVRCEAVDEVVMAETFGLPGVVQAQAVPDKDKRNVRYLIETGPMLVHSGTALRGKAEGEWVRPALHADDAHAVPGSVPWRLLRIEDKALVVEAILTLSGYGGAALPSFPDADQARREDGAGAVAPGGGVREEPARGAV